MRRPNCYTTGIKAGWAPRPRPAKELRQQAEQDAEYSRVRAELATLSEHDRAEACGRLGRLCYLASVEPGHGPYHLAQARYAAALDALGQCPKGGKLSPGSRWVVSVRFGIQLVKAGEVAR